MKIILMALSAIWVTASPDLWAADISIENDTGRIICELRLSGLDYVDWQDNLLKGPCYGQGAVRNASTPTAGRFNLLTVFEDGDFLIYYGLELGEYRHLKLGTDEAELFEWNPMAQKP